MIIKIFGGLERILIWVILKKFGKKGYFFFIIFEVFESMYIIFFLIFKWFRFIFIRLGYKLF